MGSVRFQYPLKTNAVFVILITVAIIVRVRRRRSAVPDQFCVGAHPDGAGPVSGCTDGRANAHRRYIEEVEIEKGEH